jgi:hypothetical protein
MDADKTQDMFGTDYLNQQLNSEYDLHSTNLSYLNNAANKFQRIRLEGIVTKKKIEVKKTK